MFELCKLSHWLTLKLSQNIDIEDDEFETIEYGFHIIISETSKMLVTIALMYFIGFLKYSFFVILVFGILRNFLGGVHAKSHLGCFLSYFFTVLLIISAGLETTGNQGIIIMLSVLPAVIISIMKYAPADTEEKPIISSNQRKKLKTIGLLTVLFLMIISLFIGTPYRGFIVYTIIAQVLFMNPVSYKMFKSSFSVERK
ncbi:MAG TPA: accessory gene regulator B family protein [Pseudobacteroides sp.]|uniref:accessory gene regulator ArgB-like protein n=1 Tax=Pseudobacteroides sp. TaxID=1968840 RepID=UPI002F953B69